MQTSSLHSKTLANHFISSLVSLIVLIHSFHRLLSRNNYQPIRIKHLDQSFLITAVTTNQNQSQFFRVIDTTLSYNGNKINAENMNEEWIRIVQTVVENHVERNSGVLCHRLIEILNLYLFFLVVFLFVGYPLGSNQPTFSFISYHFFLFRCHIQHGFCCLMKL